MIRRRKDAVAFLTVVVLSLGIVHASDAAPELKAASTPTVDTGVLEGAPYRVDIPVSWNGELVMQLHGFEPIGMPRATPKPMGDEAPAFLAAGYAVAQSSFASQGWAVDDALRDNERLRAWFGRRHGRPRALTWSVSRWPATSRWRAWSAMARTTTAHCRCAVSTCQAGACSTIC
jgi:hypothetical protein